MPDDDGPVRSNEPVPATVNLQASESLRMCARAIEQVAWVAFSGRVPASIHPKMCHVPLQHLWCPNIGALRKCQAYQRLTE